MVHVKSPLGLTLAITTSAPKRASVSWMHVVSISSEPSEIGISTRFFMLELLFEDNLKAVVVLVLVVVVVEGKADKIVVYLDTCFGLVRNVVVRGRKEQQDLDPVPRRTNDKAAN